MHLSADGVPIVLHDPHLFSDGDQLYLRPPQGAALSMRRMSVRELNWTDLDGTLVVHPDGSRAAIARLDEVLEAVPASLWLDVELKAGWSYDPRLVEVFCSCIQRRPERVIASSFDHFVLRELARANPSLVLMGICYARPVDPAAMLAAIPATLLCTERHFVTAMDVSKWRDQGIEVHVVVAYPALENLPEVLSWPVAGVILDDPRLAFVAAAEAGR